MFYLVSVAFVYLFAGVTTRSLYYGYNFAPSFDKGCDSAVDVYNWRIDAGWEDNFFGKFFDAAFPLVDTSAFTYNGCGKYPSPNFDGNVLPGPIPFNNLCQILKNYCGCDCSGKNPLPNKPDNSDNAGNGIGAGVGVGVDVGLGENAGTNLGSIIEAGFGLGVGVGAGLGAVVGAGVGVGLGTVVGAGVEDGLGAVVGAGVGLYAGVENGLGAGIENGPGADVGSDVI